MQIRFHDQFDYIEPSCVRFEPKISPIVNFERRVVSVARLTTKYNPSNFRGDVDPWSSLWLLKLSQIWFENSEKGDIERERTLKWTEGFKVGETVGTFCERGWSTVILKYEHNRRSVTSSILTLYKSLLLDLYYT